MNKISKKILLIVLFSFSGLYIFSQNPNILDSFPRLKERSYYSKAFTDEEKITLDEAYTKTSKGDELFAIYTDYKKEIKTLEKQAKKEKNASAKKKLTKKAAKIKKKAVKTGLEAIEYYEQANDTYYNLYEKKLKKYKKTENIKKLWDTLYSIYTFKYDTSLIIKTSASALEDSEKLDKYIIADDLQFDAIILQELAFGLFNKDTSIIDSVTKKFFPPKDTIIVKKPIYDYTLDPNIYLSKNSTIIKKLKLTTSEKTKYKTIATELENAEEFDSIYVANYELADTLQKQALTQPKALKKKTLVKVQKAQATANENLVNSAESYYLANLTLYEIYTSKIDKHRLDDDSVEDTTGMYFENTADKYFIEAEILNDAAGSLSDGTEKYEKIMIANDYIMVANQYIENAYSSYFNIDYIEVIDYSSFKGEIKPVNDTVYELDSTKLQGKLVYYLTATKDGEEVYTKKLTQNEVKDYLNSFSDGTTEIEEEEDNTEDKKYEYLSSWYYTSENTDLKKLVRKDGIYFKISVGIFDDLLPMEVWENYEPITVIKFKNTDEMQFLVGEYQTSEAADLALEKIKKKYKTAYIVGFNDGVWTSYKTAKLKITKDDDYEETIKKEKAKINGEVYNPEEEDDYEDDDLVKGKNISEVSTLVYLINLDNYETLQTRAELKKLQNVYSIKEDGKIRYLLGLFYDYETAQKKLTQVENLGFDYSYITAFNEGVEIKVKDAIELENYLNKYSANDEKDIENDAEEIDDNEISYKIQIAAYVIKLSNTEVYENFPKLKGKYTLSNYTTPDGLIAYAVGDCSTYSEVEAMMTELTNLGISDKFIVAFDGSKKISIDEAKKITEK